MGSKGDFFRRINVSALTREGKLVIKNITEIISNPVRGALKKLNPMMGETVCSVGEKTRYKNIKGNQGELIREKLQRMVSLCKGIKLFP